MVVVLGLVVSITPAAAQQATGSPAPFAWAGQLAAGSRLRIDEVHGDIRVTAAAGDRATVHADVRRSGRHRSEIVFDVVNDGGNITICARWADSPACSVRGLRDDNDDEDGGESASADFTVQLPRTLHLDVQTGNGIIDVAGTASDVVASSGNGAVRIVGATGSVHASSGNGDVTIEGAGGPVTANTGNGAIRALTAEGPVNASTGNGNIDVRMQKLGTRGPMEFTTGNGTVTVSMPGSVTADLDADTGHGRVESDFPLQVAGRIEPEHVRGTIGGGGPRLRLSTGSGNIVLRSVN
jgi:DUF4097 and DUF4098 domain-containing protein YvlB